MGFPLHGVEVHVVMQQQLGPPGFAPHVAMEGRSVGWGVGGHWGRGWLGGIIGGAGIVWVAVYRKERIRKKHESLANIFTKISVN